jgi:hypothetical protein
LDEYYWIQTTQDTKVLWNSGNFSDQSSSFLYSVVTNGDISSLTINNVNGKDAYACVNSSNDVWLQLHKLVQCSNIATTYFQSSLNPTTTTTASVNPILFSTSTPSWPHDTITNQPISNTLTSLITKNTTPTAKSTTIHR